jgi:hypothetical protein
MELFLHCQKISFFLKVLFEISRFQVLVKENELAQKVPRKTFNEQGGAGPKGGDIYIND